MKFGLMVMPHGKIIKKIIMFENIYKGKKVLVTGHTGFKGSWLTTWLLNLGAKVAGYSIGVPSNPSHFIELGIENKIEHFLGDIRDYDTFFDFCKKFEPEFIFHLAAQPLVRDSYLNPRETFEVNMIGTLNVLEVIKNLKDKIKVGVIITSDKAYDNVEWVYGYREDDKLGGEDPYSGSKGAAELITKSYMHSFFNNGFPNIATTRAGNVIGGGDWAKDRIVPDIVRSWSNNKEVEIRNPYSTRPWQHVLEPLSGYLCLGAKLYEENSKFKNSSFNFGPDSKVNKNVGELLEEMSSLWDESPGWLNKYVDDGMPEANLLKLSCDKANILLNWYPVLDFKETLNFTMKWYLNYYKNSGNIYEYTISQINSYTKKAQEKEISWSLK
jgi:CDP-glucose 4,6-dehydratase